MNIPFVKHTLANGLDLLLHQDRACPIVAVNVWYHVGSKNEVPGRTGFAHLFEHLMFEGSQHHDTGYFAPLQGAGGSLNGSTNADRTNYWEVVPSNALELALWMESDRMGYLLPALTESKFANQRDVVLNERRQNYENRPYGLAPMAMLAALFPADHPYHWTTIGETDDLHAARLDDVRRFFTTYYHPANASLSLAGDIDIDGALALAETYFGELPAGPSVEAVRPETPPLSCETRLFLEDRVELPRLYLAWLTVPMFAPGDADLDLAADILANGKTSRLYRRLVFEERIATDVSAAQNSREVAGFVQVAATAAPGHSLEEIEAVIAEEIQKLAADGPTEDEVERGRVQSEAQFMFRLQTVGGFGGKSDQLNAYNTFLGDPGFFDRDLARYRAVTIASLQEAAARYLQHEQRVALSIVPKGRPELALPASEPVDVR
jgi:zinc protease